MRAKLISIFAVFVLASVGVGMVFATVQYAPKPSKMYTVYITSDHFKPWQLTVKQGDSVVWMNNDTVPHTIKSDNGTELNSPQISKDGSYLHTFDSSGIYGYHCGNHPNATGQIVVKSVSIRKVMYLWDVDGGNSDSWVSFLTGQGFLAYKNQARNAFKFAQNLSEMDLIIIGNDTMKAWNYTYYPLYMLNVWAVKNTSKPVLAIGYGGLRYYEKAGMWMQFNNSGTVFDLNKVLALDPQNPLFNEPTPVNITPANVISVHKRICISFDIFCGGAPANMTALAMDPFRSYVYATIVAEAHKYMYWSFCTNKVADLTADGQDLFVNAIYYATNTQYVPEFQYSIALAAGGAFALTAAVVTAGRRKNRNKP